MTIFDPNTAPLPAPSSWYWRLPIVRHIRWVYYSAKIERHYAAYASIGMLPFNRGFDDRCLKGIRQGKL